MVIMIVESRYCTEMDLEILDETQMAKLSFV